MNVFANTVVKITFKLFDAGNQLVEEAPEPIEYLHGGHSGIFPKLEEALNSRKIGESVSVKLEPADAFGDYDPELIKIEPLSNLPSDVAVGGHLVAEQDGEEVVWRVTDIAEEVRKKGHYPIHRWFCKNHATHVKRHMAAIKRLQ
jgi:FKBP-type peptidyl-prolyl cis-trans isomerase SlyD